MSWIPPNLAQACAVQTTITSCQPSTVLFLQLITSLFGYSKDSLPQHQNAFIDFTNNAFLDHNLFSTENDDAAIKKKSSTDNNDVYDFIVIGAGSAGCVVANRLTEISHWNVLLLEAGDEEPEVADVPAFAPLLQRSSIDWGFVTQPAKRSCLARRNGQCAWARGKVMGGSSTINYMIYIRGHPRDYDEWAAMGNEGWSYSDVLPYFIKSEDNRDLDDQEDLERYYHGEGGYLTVDRFPYQDRNVLALVEAYEELGLPRRDQNSEHLIGTMLLQHTQRDGKRQSTNVAFIRPIRRKRRNLDVQTKAYVVRTLIDPVSKTAFGVEYVQNGVSKMAFAKKEVIVSAGAIMSPKILMLSGIGDSQHLQSFGIKVIKQLAVGYNLQDHTTIDGVLLSLANYSATSVDDQQRQRDVYYYKENQAGPLAATGPLQANAFVQTKYEQEYDRPDIQISIDATNVQNMLTDPILAAETNVNPLSYYDGLMLRPILLPPKSRGVIQLNSTDPIYGHPLIYANTFNEEIDLLRMLEGIKQGLNLLRTHAMQKVGLQLVNVPWPHCRHLIFGSDDYWICIITAYTTTLFHYSGTCKMGPHTDREAVVDAELQVHGIRNLRVIDASIMPKVVRGNTNAPVIMIGEMGSDFIKKKWLGDDFHEGEGAESYIKSSEDLGFDDPFSFKK